ncbi:SUMF1/EgtB/PvdO family nonheme iron enzyme [Chloroflexota bacterium]
MRLFVSYARIDKPYCVQIVDTLDVHDTWYDQRLYAGQDWWSVILRRLDWCQGLIYLLSPDSWSSAYCRKEFELAQSLGRFIFPVLIHDDTDLDDVLALPHVDFSRGLTPNNVRDLLNSIHVAERQIPNDVRTAGRSLTPSGGTTLRLDPGIVLSSAAEAMELGQYDKAILLLRQAKANNFYSKFINIDTLLQEATVALELQTRQREAMVEYRQIAELLKYGRTRTLGIEAFQAFQAVYPDHDPEDLSRFLAEPVVVKSRNPILRLTGGQRVEYAPPSFQMPLLNWCEIPAGEAVLGEAGHASTAEDVAWVESFAIAKYPVTNEQYELFLQAIDGYVNTGWWAYSEDAQFWRDQNPEPRPSQFQGAERPREMINWYDSLAFCRWLGAQVNAEVRLPTAAEWIRAARGAERWRYPWGEQFDLKRCNTNESKMRQTTQVNSFADGASPYGVRDMAGNVWEWTLDAQDQPGVIDITGDWERAVHGGSHIGPATRAQISFSYYLKPHLYYSSIGFRVLKEL